MLRRIAMLAAISALSIGLAGTALAGSSVVLRVVAIKTDNVTAFADAMTQANGDPEYSRLIKGLDRIRAVQSDSLYSEL